MTFKPLPIIAVIATVLIISSCKKDPDPIPSEYRIPAELEEYITSFEQESGLRGMNLEIDNLIVEFELDLKDSNDSTAAGLCYHASSQSNPRIELDTTTFNWTAHEYSKEALIFHELGHCILERSHDDELLENDSYKSIMKATGEPTYSGFDLFKREYYLDELFDPSTPPPWWALSKDNEYSKIALENKENIYFDEFVDNRNQWNVGDTEKANIKIDNGTLLFENKSETPLWINEDIDFDENSNWELETSIKIKEANNFAICFVYGGNSPLNQSPQLYYYGFNINNEAILLNNQSGDYISSPTSFLHDNGFNKLTVRKIGEYVYFYINENYYNVIEHQPFFGNEFGFLVPKESSIEVNYLFASTF